MMQTAKPLWLIYTKFGDTVIEKLAAPTGATAGKLTPCLRSPTTVPRLKHVEWSSWPPSEAAYTSCDQSSKLSEEMRRCLCFPPALAVLLQGAVNTTPSRFYIVSAFFSDYGPAFYYRVIEVSPDGEDCRVRYSRIAHVNLYCPRLVVASAETTLHNMSPERLAKASNPCAVKPGAFKALLKKYSRRGGGFEAISFGVVAQCGAASVVLKLPISQTIDLDRLRLAYPEIAGLWDLASEITDFAFGSKDLFHGGTEAEDLALQRAGQKMVPELASGRYDVGLIAAVRGNVGAWKIAKLCWPAIVDL
jgi:hypothetical protein